jgi:NAD(P)-dependent dehydrogenase (short-subunit alcohol dehydrogenase family)
MRTLAVTLGADGIAVSAAAPGLIDTPASRVVNTDEQFDATVHRQAIGHADSVHRRRRARVRRPGIEPAGGMAAYSASKAALVHLTGAIRGGIAPLAGGAPVARITRIR